MEQSAVMVKVLTVAAEVNSDQDGGSPQAAKAAPEGFVILAGTDWPWMGTAENAVKNTKQSRIFLTKAGIVDFIEMPLSEDICPSAEDARGGGYYSFCYSFWHTPIQ